MMLLKARTLICSKFFAKHDKDLYQETLQEFRKRGQLVAAPRSHCKIVCMEFENGETLVAESSANLRSNQNREQTCLVNDIGLHTWHCAWFDELLSSHESD
jgi:hypothetical protein